MASREHPYAKDLDLFGRGSLYQLLCTARTRMGQDTLAAWLRESTDTATILARQAAVEELRGTLDLREDLAVLDASMTLQVQPETLVAWIGKPPLLSDWARPLAAMILAMASVVALVAWIFFAASIGWFLLVAVLQSLLLRSMRREIEELTSHLDSVLSELELLLQVLRIIEAQRFVSPRIVGDRPPVARRRTACLAANRSTGPACRYVGNDPPQQVRRPFRVGAHAHGPSGIRHPALAEGQRAAGGDWLEAVGEFEALSCLAGYAYEHPECPFPAILENGPCLDAAGLGHPLIPAKRRVTNDVRLGREPQLLLVSGSNMSGKSTLLRTVGINTVLALAGAPVCAAQMRVSRLAVASAMRTMDSLQEGVSGFYAEIQRLRMICELERQIAAGAVSSR